MNIDSSMPSDEPSRLVYRDYQPGDEKQIVALMAPYWSHTISCDEWIHEYIGSPDGPTISRVCEIDGRIVAHYALILMQMTVAGRNVLGGKGEGSIVDKEYRKTSPRLKHLLPPDRAIFTRLSREVWEAGIARGVDIMWGFPNKMALGGHLKAGWDNWVWNRRMLIRPVCIMGTARFFTGIVPSRCQSMLAYLAAGPLWFFTRRLRSFRHKRGATVVLVDEFDERVEYLWQRLAERHRFISINRNCHHLNWRFAHEPYLKVIMVSKGRVVGYVIGLPEDNRGVHRLNIVDIVIDDDLFSEIGQLLGGLLEATKTKIDLISISSYYSGCDYGERLNKEVRKYFFPASRLRPQATIIKVNPVSGDENIIKNPANWFVSDLFRELF